MAIESALLAWPLLACFIALPAVAAWRRRRASRETSAVALELTAFAEAVRAAGRCLPLGDALLARLAQLRVADAAPLCLAQENGGGGAEALASAAQRLASRLRRRVAFERKMLARSAPGLRRAAIAASLPPLLMFASQAAGVTIPGHAQLALLIVEGLGCALLWRVTRVEV